MAHSLCVESTDLALELREFLVTIDPARFRQELEAAARRRLNQLRLRLAEILKTYEGPLGDRRLIRLYDGLQTLSRQLEELRPRAEQSARRMRREWQQFQRRLQPAYGAIASRLERLSAPVPALRSTNYGRSFFHLCSALFSLAMIQYVLSVTGLKIAAVSFAAFCWINEALRVRYPSVTRAYMKLMGRIAHPHEHHKVNSSTWYATALALLALAFNPMAASVAVIVLGVADPMAAIVGRRFGRTALRGGRTLEGSLAFVGSGTLAVVGLLMLYYPDLGLQRALLAAVAASTLGALAELFSFRLDDNLTIPLAAGLGAMAIFTAFGL
jgi:dolichol kinase